MVSDPNFPCVENSTGTESNLIYMIVKEIVTPAVTIAASESPVEVGVPVAFTATPVNGGTPSYEWYVNGSKVSNGTFYVYIPEENDQVFSIMTSSLECATSETAISNIVTMDLIVVGLDDIDLSAVTVYPNPATNELNIKIMEGLKQIRLFNSIGQVVIESDVTGESVKVLNVKQLNAGIYTLQFLHANGMNHQKKIILRK